MAWEMRDGGLYYYRTLRVNGRVMRQYLGYGQEALDAAEQVELRRIQREADRQEARRERAQWESLNEQVVNLIQQSNEDLHTSLIKAGCYQHRRQWRKRGSDSTAAQGS